MAPSRPPAKDGKAPKAGDLLTDAETQFAVGNLDEAISLGQQALDVTGDGGDFELRALNLLGMLHIEIGDVDEALTFFERAVKLDEDGTVDEKLGGGPEKFMFLAQLSEEGGKDSVTWFERGAAALRKQIQPLSEMSNRTAEQQAIMDEKQQRLSGVLCAVVEVYMTDLSWEDDAEQRCEALVTEAMMIAPSSPETWQTVANVRISQEKTDEAKGALKRSLELWQDLPPEHPSVPEFPTRISLARLLLEVGMEEDALKVLQRLVSDDDQSVEAWYLGGWCLFIVGEKMKEGKEASEEEWKGVWTSARKWIAMCMRLFELQEYEDDRLGQHAQELCANINQVLGEPTEADLEWDEGSDDEDDEDEEMEG